MKYLLSFLFFVILSGATAQNKLKNFFSQTDQFLKTYTQNGKVNYVGIARNGSDLKNLLNFIAQASVEGLTKNEEIAFYINSYNILVIDQVITSVKNASRQTAKSVDGFFDAQNHTVGGEKLTLDDIEQKKLISPTQDPRIHFVLVCAARGCPKIPNFAIQPDILDEQLNLKTQMALDDPDFIRVSAERKEVAVSEIFSWYEDDFLKKYGSIREFINTYRTKKLNPDYELTKYTYDWTLNN